MKVAALDLGTNTFLCLIVEGDKQGIKKVLSDQVRTVRLGQGVDKSGRLQPEALVRAREALTFFKHEIEKHKVDKVLAMATSAARDAENGDELYAIGRDLNIPIQTIPGSDEARISYAGATVGRLTQEKKVLVIDVGGGSTEFILGQGNKVLFSQSIDIGGVRLTERFISRQPIPEQETKLLQEEVRKKIQELAAQIKSFRIDEILAVAGTPTSIAAIEFGGFDEKKIDGHVITKDKLAEWVKIFSATTVDEKKEKYGLAGRADIIFAGATVLLEAIDIFKKEGMSVSTKGLRYGIALELLK